MDKYKAQRHRCLKRGERLRLERSEKEKELELFSSSHPQRKESIIGFLNFAYGQSWVPDVSMGSPSFEVAPGEWDTSSVAHFPIPSHSSLQHLGLVNASLLSPSECIRQGGYPRGPSCHTVPDIAFFSLLLFFTSFLCAMALKHVRNSRLFPSVVSAIFPFCVKGLVLALDPDCKWEKLKKKWDGRPRVNRPLYGQVRKVFSDFSSVLAILLGCGLDAFLGLATPKLLVPTEFKVRAGPKEEGGGGWWGQQLRSNKMYKFHTFLPLSPFLHS